MCCVHCHDDNSQNDYHSCPMCIAHTSWWWTWDIEIYLQRSEESDHKADSESPLIDTFYTSRVNLAIRSMCNFTLPELQMLYYTLHNCTTTFWNVLHANWSSHTSMDEWFMSFVVINHRGSWDTLGHIFCIKGPPFMMLITNFISKLNHFVRNDLLKIEPRNWTASPWLTRISYSRTTLMSLRHLV